MLDNVTGVLGTTGTLTAAGALAGHEGLAETGTAFSAAALIWWPMAIFALLAVGIALLRIGLKRRPIEP